MSLHSSSLVRVPAGPQVRGLPCTLPSRHLPLTESAWPWARPLCVGVTCSSLGGTPLSSCLGVHTGQKQVLGPHVSDHVAPGSGSALRAEHRLHVVPSLLPGSSLAQSQGLK